MSSNVKPTVRNAMSRMNVGKMRDFNPAFLPPMMIYFAFGASALTSLVSAFWVKEALNVPPAFLAEVAFWAAIPWILKVPIGHFVDVFWKWKGAFLFVGALFLGMSFSIQWLLVSQRAILPNFGLTPEAWYAVSAWLGSAGYVMQDVVADAITIEVVFGLDRSGNQISEERIRRCHIAMQTFGRVAVVAGSITASLINIVLFDNISSKLPEARTQVYLTILELALFIPLVSVLGFAFQSFVIRRRRSTLVRAGLNNAQIADLLDANHLTTRPNSTIILASVGYVIFTLAMGGIETVLTSMGVETSGLPFIAELIRYRDVLVFCGSVVIVFFLMAHLRAAALPEHRGTFTATALVVFATGLVPQFGEGVNWWQIDVLGFEQQLQSNLMLIGNLVALAVMAGYLRFLGGKSVLFVSVLVAVVGAIFMVPYIAMFWGFHEWLALATGGLMNARTIGIINFAAESPLQQIVTIPAMAWAANAAPRHLKATFFAVIATYANVASSGSRLLTRLLNDTWSVERGSYENVGTLMIVVTLMSLLFPLLVAVVAKASNRKSW